MTNIEAIEWLTNIKNKYIHGGDEWYDRRRREAIDYTIGILNNLDIESARGHWEYGNGYRDGKAEAMASIVRCKYCKYGFVDNQDFPNEYLCRHNGCDWNDGEHFCGYGERRYGNA